MKILLCLLSAQHVPNLLSVHHYKPDQLVLVESSQMKSQGISRHFLNALKLGGMDYENRSWIKPLGAEDDLAVVRDTLTAAFDRFSSAEWIANVTGGTKPMSISTYEFFKERGGKIVYMNLNQPARIMDLVNGSFENCIHRPKIKEFLAGYGFESRKTDEKVTEAEVRATGWHESAQLFALYANDFEVLTLDDKERKKARDKGIELSKDRFTFPCDRLRQIWLGDSPSRKLSKYEAEFLTGGWLEVFFWKMLTKHAEDLGIWDVRLGLEVGRCGDPTGNDFDVSFMHNHKLSMIECKSGSQDHDPGSDILYKVEAVTRQFRALAVQSYLSTTSGNVLDKELNVKASLRSRSDIYKCKILTAADIRTLASESVTPEVIKSVLFNSGNP